MGKSGSRAKPDGADHDKPSKWGWQFLPGHANDGFTDDLIRQRVSVAINRRSFEGHAYSIQELAKFRRILAVTVDDWPDSKLWKETDSLIASLAHDLATTPKKAISRRCTDLQKRLLRPAREILSALNEEEIAKEFWQRTGSLRKAEYHDAIASLNNLISAVENHCKHLGLKRTRKRLQDGTSKTVNERPAPRRPWDGWLKEQFAYRVAYLCNHINPTVFPTRNTKDDKEIDSRFGKALSLLGEAVFEPWGKRLTTSFAGALRTISEGLHAEVILAKSKNGSKTRTSSSSFKLRISRGSKENDQRKGGKR